MTTFHFLLTGFGPFLKVKLNPSGEVVRVLGEEGIEGLRLTTSILPVTFRGAPLALQVALAELGSETPNFLLSLGAQTKPWFRLESRARARLDSKKPDLDSCFARELEELEGGRRHCQLDLEPLAEVLRSVDGADVRVSNDAGGYVCERTYHALLSAAEKLGIPALFLHLPPLDQVDLERQARHLRKLLLHLAREGGVRLD